MVVVLPAPLGPKKANNSPGGMSRSSSWTAVLLPYRLVTRSSLIMVGSWRLAAWPRSRCHRASVHEIALHDPAVPFQNGFLPLHPFAALLDPGAADAFAVLFVLDHQAPRLDVGGQLQDLRLRQDARVDITHPAADA